MIFTAPQIYDMLERGFVINADKSQVNATSLDVTLGDMLMLEKSPTVRAQRAFYECNLDRSVAPKMAELVMDPDIGYEIMPGEFLLAHTRERLHMPLNVSAQYVMKSSAARIGLEQLNACWIHAGFEGVLTLELKNMTRHHIIRIKPGDRIGQLVFYRHDKVHQFVRSPYDNQDTVSGVRPEVTHG